jgi:hypothetical protein
MPPPASYIDITSSPFVRTVTQAEFNASNEIWFRKVTTAATIFGMQTTSGGTFTPITTVFGSDGSTVVRAATTGTAGSWCLLPAADTYYVKITRNGGGASNFDFTSTFNVSPYDAIDLDPGDLIINDDADLPGVVVSSTGTLKGFTSTVPGGEMGAMLRTGVSIWHDRYGNFHATNTIAVLDATLDHVASVACGMAGVAFPLFAHDRDSFYVCNSSNQLWTVTAAGIAANTGFTFSTTPHAIGVNTDGTILYWVHRNVDGIIHRVDLNTLTNLSNLYTISGFATGSDDLGRTPNGHPGDLFVLADGSVVTFWYDTSLTTHHVIHVSAAGALLNDIAYVDPMQVNHLAQIEGSSNTVAVWLYTTVGFDTGQFGTLNLTTGAISADFTVPMFQSGINMLGTSTMFGISTSCTFVQVPYPQPVLEVSDPCCPCDCPPSPGSPGGAGPSGSPVSTPLPSHTGAILPQVSVDGRIPWTAACTGGGDVPTAADATDAESWVS